MAIVRPFRAIRYDPAVVGPLDSVVAPPYDVIREDEQRRLYTASPYNVIRLDLSRETDRYGSAARTFREWLDEGALARDEEPAFYGYAQRFFLKDGAECERFGFFARLRLEDFSSGIVRPHEKTLPSAKADRLELQRACRANLSPIFGLYSAPGWSARAVAGGAPLAEIDDAAGTRHRLSRVTEPGAKSEIERRLADRAVYIADGHHRYETALRYRDEQRAAGKGSSGEEPFDFVLAFLCNLDEPGLVVLPTHRLVRELGRETVDFATALQNRFRIEEHADREAFLRALAPGEGERRIGVVLRGLALGLVVVARESDGLDVTILHDLVLRDLLGLEAKAAAEANRLVYSKDRDECFARVESGEFAAAFLLNATKVEEVRAVSDAGQVMPEKSTYFYPKLLTGLVFNSVED